jgi:hypothetical protein
MGVFINAHRSSPEQNKTRQQARLIIQPIRRSQTSSASGLALIREWLGQI